MERATLLNLCKALLWLGAISVAILLIPSFVRALPPTDLLLRDYFPSAIFVFVYGTVGLAVTLFSYYRRRLSSIEISIIGFAGLSLVYAILLFFLPPVVVFSKSIGLGSTIVIVLSTAVWLAIRSSRWLSSVVAVLLVAVLVSANLMTVKDERHLPVISTVSVGTSLYQLEATVYRNMIPRPFARGGGFVTLDEKTLIVTGDGEFFEVVVGEDTSLDFRKLSHRVPMNTEAFVTESPSQTDTARYRTTGITIVDDGDMSRVYVAHHYWKSSESCFVLRVSELGDAAKLLTESPVPLQWQTVFDSSPCLPLRSFGSPFSGHVAGGRLVAIDDARLLLTIGDHGWNGVHAIPSYAQLDGADYGKVVEIDLTDGSTEIVSKGHRNAQGLVVDSDGQIWSTEHGMEGGDELNLIVAEHNYGWPNVTYSTDYGSRIWPGSESPGRHSGYQLPAFSWLPGIGISNLIEIRGTEFSHWRGDLLISSLVGSSLFRVRRNDETVIAIERISVSDPTQSIFRMRDLIETSAGDILLWLDGGTVVSISRSAKPSDGEGLFAANCGGCHKIGDGTEHGIGPDLLHIFGGEIAASPDFDYSPALTGMDGTWTKPELDAYLANPAAVVPGTSMVFPGVGNEDARNLIIEYMSNPNPE